MTSLPDLHQLLETMVIVSIVSIAAIGFVTGLKAIVTDLTNFRRARV